MLPRSIHCDPPFQLYYIRTLVLTFAFSSCSINNFSLITTTTTTTKTNSDHGSQAIESSSLYLIIIFANDYSCRSVTVQHFFNYADSSVPAVVGTSSLFSVPELERVESDYARCASVALLENLLRPLCGEEGGPISRHEVAAKAQARYYWSSEMKVTRKVIFPDIIMLMAFGAYLMSRRRSTSEIEFY
jgi:hypothetical protein